MEEFGEKRGGFGRSRRFGGRNRGSNFGQKPVKVGEEYDVQVESVAEKGDGVAKIKGLIVFVPGAQKGENVKIKIKELRRKCAIAEKVGAPSSEAAEAPAEETEAFEENFEESEEDF